MNHHLPLHCCCFLFFKLFCILPQAQLDLLPPVLSAQLVPVTCFQATLAAEARPIGVIQALRSQIYLSIPVSSFPSLFISVPWHNGHSENPWKRLTRAAVFWEVGKVAESVANDLGT